MGIIRGQKFTKLTYDQLVTTVLERGHTLINVERSLRNPNNVPKQGRVCLRCDKCQSEWDTKLYVYLERKAPSFGCRTCYTNLSQDPNLYPNSPLRKKETNNLKPKRRAGKDVLNAAFQNGPYSHIKNVKDLINYLKENPNLHNNKALELVLRNEGLKKQKINPRDFFKEDLSYHHVLPIHDNGPPASWNIIPVTKEEHHLIHVLRYETFKQKEDLLATYGTKSDMLKFETGHFQKVRKPKPNKSYFIQNLPEEVRVGLERGMIFTHNEGYELVIKPNTLQTTKEIQEGLLAILPDGHEDKSRILKNKTSVNYLRSLVITAVTNGENLLSKKVYSAYGFTVKLLK